MGGATPEALALQERLREQQVPDVGRLYGEERLRGDFEVAENHRALYRTRRGRSCEYPGCSEAVRYTKPVAFCWRHDGTEMAHHARHLASGHKGGGLPRLYGLREARMERGITRAELAEACGRHSSWVDKLEVKRNGSAPEIGTTPTMRRHLAGVLEVSEQFLLEGSGGLL